MALATNKRRFYNLLDNLSSSKINSAQGPKSSAQSTDRPAKRTRMPHSVPTSTKSGPRPVSTSIRTLKSGSTTTTTRVATNQGIEGGSTYAPWSQDQFLTRLETFSDVKIWTTKPELLSDVYWAKRGWTVAGFDEVACRSCGKHMLVQIGMGGNDGEEEGDGEKEQDWWQEGIEQDYVDRYAALIVDGHMQDCLWRKAGCKDDIYRIKFSDPAKWQTELNERYNSLVKTSSALPINLVDPSATRTSKEDQADLQTVIDYFTRSASGSKIAETAGPVSAADEGASKETQAQSPIKSAAESDRIKTAAILAVCGWIARDVAGVHIASCQKCFARVGLWMYARPSSVVSPGKDDDGDSMKFDPVSLHRAHCPWQNPISQGGLGVYSGHAAWEIVVELLGLEASREVRRKSVRIEKVVLDHDSEDNEDEEQLPVSRESREETDRQDKERESRLERLKRAFTTKNTIKKPRPLSSRSTTSFLSTRSFHRRDDSR